VGAGSHFEKILSESATLGTKLTMFS
jgi:hypothetical protein